MILVADTPFDISIHALHEESDHFSSLSTGSMLFQSTLSMRRATAFVHDVRRGFWISIHALHEESDSVAVLPCGVG